MPETQLISDPQEAANLLRQGGTVAIPTETVYGLAARFDSSPAVANIFAAKGRPSDNPLIVHIASSDWLSRVASEVPPAAARLLQHFSPGPLTVTVPRSSQVPSAVTAGLNSVAVRIPDHDLTQAVLTAVDVPLVAPSANRSGRPSPTTWQAVREELDGLIDGILIGPPASIGIESTVVDCCSHPARLLRPGGISFEQLSAIVPEIQLYNPRTDSNQDLASPGLRHRHYSPRCKVILIEDVGSVEPAISAAMLSLVPPPHPEHFAWTNVYSSAEAYAADLFESFRRADRDQLAKLYCQAISEKGIGRGLMDRLRRASEGH